jgi:hypothetical protein
LALPPPAGDDFEVFTELQKARATGKKVNPAKFSKTKGTYDIGTWWTYGAWDATGVRRKFYSLNYDILRNVAQRVVLVSAIHNTRCSQMRPFLVPQDDEDKPGFKIKIKDRDRQPNSNEKKGIDAITEFFLNTGFTDFPGAEEREDDLTDAVERWVRDLMTIDQIGVELQQDNGNRILAFHALDGASIHPVDPKVGFKGDKSVKYVQMFKEKVVAEFLRGEIIFDMMNKRSDIRHRRFGYSPLEQSIDTVTAFLFATAYNKDQFNLASIPKGFFSFDPKFGSMDRETLEELQREWHAMFAGIKGMWRTPFLQHGAKWNNVAPNNRDMEYDKYMQMLAAYVCAVYKIDPAELGLKFGDRSQLVIGERQEEKLKYSKDRGVKDLLFFFTSLFNKIIKAQPGWEGFKFEFTGTEHKDQTIEIDNEQKQVNYKITVNEARKRDDMEPIEGGDTILNPAFMQAKQQKEQAAQMAAQGGPPGEEPPPEGEEEGGGLESMLAQMGDKEMDQAVEQGMEAVTKSSDDDGMITIRL